MLPHELLLGAGSGSAGTDSISPALIDRLHAASSLATVLGQLHAQQAQARDVLSAAVKALQAAGSAGSAGSGSKRNKGSTKQRTNKHKQKKKQKKEEQGHAEGTSAALVGAATEAAAAQLDAAAKVADEVQQLLCGADAAYLRAHLTATAAQFHSSLTAAILDVCRSFAAAPSTPSTAALPLQHAVNGGLANLLRAAAVYLTSCSEVAKLWCGLFFALPAALLAQFDAVEVVTQEQLCASVTAALSGRGRTCSNGMHLYLLPATCDGMDGTAASAVLLQRPSNSSGPLVLQVVADAATAPGITRMLQGHVRPGQPGGQEQDLACQPTAPAAVLEHCVVVDSDNADATSSSSMHAVALILKLQLLLSGPSALSSAGAGSDAAVCAAKPAVADINLPGFSERLDGWLRQLLAYGSFDAPADTVTVCASKVLQQLQLLQSHLDRFHETALEQDSSSALAEEAAAALQAVQQLPYNQYQLQNMQQEVQALVQKLYASHFAVHNLAEGHALLQALRQVAQHASHVEAERIRGYVKKQMGCADTYIAYVRLVSKLRSLAKQLSRHVQRQVYDSTEGLYSAAPTACGFLLDMTADMLSSFEVSPNSIRLTRQHSLELLQQRDEQLIRILKQLGFTDAELQDSKLAALLQSEQQLLTGPVQAADAAGAAEQQLAQQLQLDNEAMRDQLKQQRLARVAGDLQRLVAEAQKARACPHLLVSVLSATAQVLKMPASPAQTHLVLLSCAGCVIITSIGHVSHSFVSPNHVCAGP
jgi:hypothetical protein